MMLLRDSGRIFVIVSQTSFRSGVNVPVLYRQISACFELSGST